MPKCQKCEIKGPSEFSIVLFILISLFMFQTSCAKKGEVTYFSIRENIKANNLILAWENFDSLKRLSPEFKAHDTTLINLKKELDSLTCEWLYLLIVKNGFSLDLSHDDECSANSTKFFSAIGILSKEGVEKDSLYKLVAKWHATVAKYRKSAADGATKQQKYIDKNTAETKLILIGKWIGKHDNKPKRISSLVFNNDGTFEENDRLGYITVKTTGTFIIDNSVVYRQITSNLTNGVEKHGDSLYDKGFEGEFLKVTKGHDGWEITMFSDVYKYEDARPVFVK